MIVEALVGVALVVVVAGVGLAAWRGLRVPARTRPGSIILLHPWAEGRAETRRALPAIIRGLKARGYRLVTVSELVALGR